MPTGVHVKPERMHDRLSCSGHLISIQSLPAQQPIHRSRGNIGQELALWIRPKMESRLLCKAARYIHQGNGAKQPRVRWAIA